jgi:phage gpG-like protein
VEFGTGRLVDLQHLTKLGFPASYAMQFKGKGIKKVNLPARPFFFTNLRKELGDLTNRLETKIKQLTK